MKMIFNGREEYETNALLELIIINSIYYPLHSLSIIIKYKTMLFEETRIITYRLH